MELEGPAHLPLLGLACVCDELGQPGRALQYLRRAYEIDPHDASIAFGLGLCHEQQGELIEAVDSYGRAAELCPQLRNARERLAAIADELADICCYVLAMANELGLDLSTAVAEKIAKNEAKYPADEYRGRFGPDDPGESR